MADQGRSFNDIIASLSGMGSSSASLADMSLTGPDSQVRALTDYDSFANHVFFGDAIARFRNAKKYIEDTYPIGLSGHQTTDSTNLSAANVYAVDKWKKEAKSFDLWLLDEYSQTGTITAAATNHNGEQVGLPWVKRNVLNAITGSQTAVTDSISGEAHSYEDEGLAIINQTAGSTNDGVVYGLTSEMAVHRGPNLKGLLPEVLFAGDENGVLEALVASFGDMLDEIKEYIDQIPNIRHISYDEVNRIPNKFLPVLAKEMGVDLFQSAVNSAVDSFMTDSSSGASTQEIAYSLWNRIINNLTYMMKSKGTRESIEAIGRVYGLDHNYLKTDEYSIFNTPKQIKDIEEVDTPVLFSTGDVHVQLPSSVSAFDWDAEQNWTLEARISATGTAAQQKIFVHPKYELVWNPLLAQLVWDDLAGTSATVDASSISALAKKQDAFVNVVASRTGDNLKVWMLALTGTGSGSEQHVTLASGVTTGVESMNLDSSGGFGGFGAYFPGSGSFSGYIHEVRGWNVPLEETDLKEHTRNFQSVSFQGSTASNAATYASLSAHYKLKENIVQADANDFIQDSTTNSHTASTVNFGNQSDKRYRVFSNMQKIVKWYPSGLAVDNDKVRLSASETDDLEDIGYVSFHMTPVNAVNRDIKNIRADLNVIETLGDPEDLYRPHYTGNFVTIWKDVLTRYGLSGVVDFNTFIDSVDKFNDVLGGIYPFIKQFTPAKTNILSEGVLIENHALERPKIARKVWDLRVQTPTGGTIATHHSEHNTAATAATTGVFQGYKYQNGHQLFLTNSISSAKDIKGATNRNKSTNAPRFSQARVGRILPVRVTPADPNATDVEITLNRLTMSPTAGPSAHNGHITGRVRLLRNGKIFRTETPALEFVFPTSSDKTNLFVAQVGDIANGKGRIISGTDTKFTTKIDSNDIQIELQLSDAVRALSGDDTSLSGTIGVEPIQIVNLFSRDIKVVRIGIGNDDSVFDSLGGQGGERIST